MKRLEDITSWRSAKELNNVIFEIISRPSIEEDQALRDQLNRSAASIADNIAEGFGRNGNKEFIQFLSFSKGSCVELKSQLYRARDRKYIAEDEFRTIYDKVDHIERMNSKLINYLKVNTMRGTKFKKS